MGESKLKRARDAEALLAGAGLQAVSGRVHVRWETKSAATPMGQLACFIEFLTLTGLWSRWQEDCPLRYSSPNAPSRADVLGTWMLSVLAGHKRYAHVTAIRCDGVNPGLMGMNKVISEDAMRNALKRIPETAGTAWLDQHLAESVAPLLDAPWILDIDTHDLHRCQLAARTVALIYNWWSLFVRLANPKARREAITSRPWLMSSVGRRTEHAGQTTITLTGQHADFGKARAALMHVSALLQGWVGRAAEQLNPTTVWNLVCDHIKRVVASIGPPQNIRLLANVGR